MPDSPTAPHAAPQAADEGVLKTQDLEVRGDPWAEWKEMYREAWRIQRDFFYDPGYHGLDLKAAEKRYEPYLVNLGSRRDLNYIFAEALGEMTVGHMYIFGGDSPEVKKVQTVSDGRNFDRWPWSQLPQTSTSVLRRKRESDRLRLTEDKVETSQLTSQVGRP